MRLSSKLRTSSARTHEAPARLEMARLMTHLLACPKPRVRKRPKLRGAMPEKIQWLHECPCAICHAWPAEAHHERRFGEPADDRKTIPLGATCHHRDGPESRHVLGREGFETRHGVSLEALCADYQRRWEER